MLMFLHPQHLNHLNLEHPWSRSDFGAFALGITKQGSRVQSLWCFSSQLHLRWQDCVKASNQSFQVGNPPVKPSVQVSTVLRINRLITAKLFPVRKFLRENGWSHPSESFISTETLPIQKPRCCLTGGCIAPSATSGS